MKVIYAIAGVVLIVAALSLALIFSKAPAIQKNAAEMYAGTPYTEIVNPSGFVNTGPIALKDIVGKKVILVDFLTYSCINCQRTFPYLRAWYEAYHDKGFEIVAIHTPEFAFEKDIANVKAAASQFGLTFPIVLDNAYGTWNAYHNSYWPHKYLIDIHGNVVYDHIGEGGYEETETKIRALLDERAHVLGETNNDALVGNLAASKVRKDIVETQSPETYFGSLRNERLGNGIPGAPVTDTFVVPGTLASNTLYLSGSWAIGPEYAETRATGASVVYRYDAKDVYIVAAADSPSAVEVLIDDVVVGTLTQTDVVDGVITVRESKLYHVMHADSAESHQLELRVKEGRVRFYAFTFG